MQLFGIHEVLWKVTSSGLGLGVCMVLGLGFLVLGLWGFGGFRVLGF